MKKLAIILLGAFALSACSDDDGFEPRVDELITICCYDEFNNKWETIEVNEVQLRRHLEHGDSRSPCSGEEQPENPM